MDDPRIVLCQLFVRMLAHTWVVIMRRGMGRAERWRYPFYGSWLESFNCVYIPNTASINQSKGLRNISRGSFRCQLIMSAEFVVVRLVKYVTHLHSVVDELITFTLWLGYTFLQYSGLPLMDLIRDIFSCWTNVLTAMCHMVDEIPYTSIDTPRDFKVMDTILLYWDLTYWHLLI